MKKIILLILSTLFAGGSSIAAVTVISNSGLTFNPAQVTINVGDTIQFNIASSHNVREVSQATYNANGTTGNGGFSLGFGGGQLTGLTAGTYYYVCTPHASAGMKGIITVTTTTSLDEPQANLFDIILRPSPIKNEGILEITTDQSERVSIDVVSITGQTVKSIIADLTITPGVNKVPVNTQDLDRGFYFVQLRFADRTKAIRFIKQ